MKHLTLVWCGSSLDNLGHHIDANGIMPLDDKLGTIKNFPKPANMSQLKRFAGMIAFHKKFIPKCAEIMSPIYALHSPHKYSKKPVCWTEKADKAFNEIIDKVCLLITLAYPVKNAQPYLVTDASNVAAGEVLP